MEQPCLEKMMTNLESKYALVTVAAKRARQLTNGDPAYVEKSLSPKVKSVSLAMQEIAAGKIKVTLVKGGIK